jgi:predicted sugar kinase
MDRRSVLKSFVVLSAGVAFLPSCKDPTVKGTVSLKKIQLSGDEENMLADLSETIVPVKAEAPADAAHYFVLTMVNDCFAEKDQKKFMEGLKQFGQLAQKQFNKSFVQCSTEEKHKLLQQMQDEKGSGEAVSYFYNTTRSLTLQHYMTSKYYLVNVRKFEMAPARFNGCFPIEKKSA